VLSIEKSETLVSIEKLRKLTPNQSSITELNQSSSPNPELIPTLGLNNNKGNTFSPLELEIFEMLF